ncbi:MAG: meso-butanediol dehydrogenase/(S,S)-butanediol dehydrogenase/diacetyl reductase [Verrucomicrobiales bacterium]|jgi:meso-butanediol dehydrogenase/(S,S)-butanediol dehydrogenase/diacetyl reductase
MNELQGKIAVITGATSGIGAATAKAFADAGAKVVLSGRSSTGAEATAAAIASVGGDTRVRLGDLSNSGFCDELVAFAVAEFGRLDVLANVAGTITRGDATETSDEEWHRSMSVNVDSVFFMSRAAVRQMRSQAAAGGPTGGTIVNLASNVGLVGSAGLPAYCASKGAVVLLTKSMALDHAAEGIRVNALCPGAVDTPMLISGHDKTGRTADEVFASNIAGIPEGRIPSPDEIARSMLYLASDASSHVTGVALPIDGGYVAG